MTAPRPKSSSSAGGSALTSLKSNLKSIGLLGNAKKISKRKHLKLAAHGEKDARKEKLRQFQSDKVNPFELKFNRKKHEVLGRKVKGTVGKPGVAKKAGLENRQKSLLVEYKRKDKVGSFVDRRFGEADPTMTVEDKMLERFMLEKKKKSQSKAVYNLESDEEELTHFGQSLSKLDDNIAEHDPRLDDGEDSGAGIDKDLVNALHFGGFDGDDYEEGGFGDKKKTHAEIMKEVMAKSKLHKYERQKAKEENEELRKELNEDFPELRALLFGNNDNGKSEVVARDGRADDYDKIVKELHFEKKAKPTNRLKTEEEIVREEAEKLLALEKKRLRRMQGLPSDSEDESDENNNQDSVYNEGGDNLDSNYNLIEGHSETELLKGKRAREESAPLHYKDGKLMNPEAITMRRINTAASSDDEESEEDEDDSSDEESEEEVSDDSSDTASENDDSEVEKDGFDSEGKELCTESSETDCENDSDKDSKAGFSNNYANPAEHLGELANLEQDLLDQISASEVENSDEISDDDFLTANELSFDHSSTAPAEKLPFTFKAPENYSEFLSIIEGYSLNEQATIIDRIRVLHHPSLAEGNQDKLKTLLRILICHFESFCKYFAASTRLRENGGAVESIQGTIPDGTSFSDILAVYIKHISELAQKYPDTISTLAVERLKIFHKSFSARPVQLTAGCSAKPLVRLNELMLVALLFKIFPTSDFQHSVITPTFMIVSEWLMALSQRICSTRAPISSTFFSTLIQDVSSGILISQLLVQSQNDSKRYFPESLIFLYSLIGCFLNGCGRLDKSVCTFPDFSPREGKSPIQIESYTLKVEKKMSLFDALTGKLDIATFPENLRGLFIIAVDTILELAKLYEEKEENPSTENVRQQNSADSLNDDFSEPLNLSKIYTNISFGGTWGWVELFQDLIYLMEVIANSSDCTIAKSRLNHLKDIRSKILKSRAEISHRVGYDGARVPLQWQKQKARSIRMFTPQFEENYNMDRHYGQDGSKAQEQKLKTLHKREMKGALRELRKDSAFLASEKLKEQRVRDQDYQSKIKRVFGMLSSEQGEINAEKRAKRK